MKKYPTPSSFLFNPIVFSWILAFAGMKKKDDELFFKYTEIHFAHQKLRVKWR
jgi:hypothetical protein